MKIAVTGGTGFLGQYVVESIKNDGNTPIILTRSIGNKAINDYEYRVSDYTLEDLINQLNDVDAVVHLAATRGSQGKISE
ncbi:NAD-dependent epimerase/dehydratase family protein, partial [Bacillus cereus]